MSKKWKFRITGRPVKKPRQGVHFGGWLKNKLHSNKITVTQFAKEIGVDKANLYNYIAGRSMPSVAILIYIIKGISRVTGDSFNTVLINTINEISKDI